MRRAFAAALLLALAAVAGVIGTSLGMNRALREADKAQRMNTYLRGMISFLDPSQVQGQEITLRQVLDNASRRVHAELGGQPEVAWEMLRAFAARMREMSEQLEGITLREVTTRLARYLVSEAAAAGIEHRGCRLVHEQLG